MTSAAICARCATKLRAGHKRCPRCRALVVVADPAQTAASSRRLQQVSAAIIGAFALVVIGLWLTSAPGSAPAATAAPPRPARIQPPAADAEAAAAPVAEAAERTFLDPAGSGAVSYGAGDYQSALAQYQAAIERNPQDAESLSNLGQVLVRLNRAPEAIPYFQRAIEIIPNRWTYQFNLARALGQTGQIERSVATYRRAQELFPNDPVTTFNLALTLHKSGDEAAAVVEYQKAIAAEPGDASFRMALGQSYEQLQKPAEAISAYQEALRLSPDAPDADKVRARIAQLTGKPL